MEVKAGFWIASSNQKSSAKSMDRLSARTKSRSEYWTNSVLNGINAFGLLIVLQCSSENQKGLTKSGFGMLPVFRSLL